MDFIYKEMLEKQDTYEDLVSNGTEKSRIVFFSLIVHLAIISLSITSEGQFIGLTQV